MTAPTEVIDLRDSLGRTLPGGAVIFTISSEGGPHVKARLHCPDGTVEVERTEEDLIAADPWQHVQIGDDGPPVSTDPTEWCGHDCLGDPCNRSADQPHTHHLVTGPDGRVFAVHETLAVITETTR